ncbi:MAG: PDZ domain-containing protein, partial [Planctomycetes bacterium]|nr:PDZ domain-containing protein [Planctomycetota bacterium]
SRKPRKVRFNMKTRTILISVLLILGLGTVFYVVLMGQAKEVTEKQVKSAVANIDKAVNMQELNIRANELEELGSGALKYIRKAIPSININSKVFVYKIIYNWGDTEYAIERLMFILRNYNKSTNAQILAANVLSQIGNSELESQLISALEVEENEKVKVAIADCLYATCKETKKSLNQMRKGVGSDDVILSKAAVFALARAGRVQDVEKELRIYAELPNSDGLLAREYIKNNRLRIKLEEAMLPSSERPDTHDYADNEKPEVKQDEKDDPRISSQIFKELLLMIQRRYLDKDKTDKTQLLINAAHKMLDELDPYSAYIHDSQELENWQKTLTHKYPGIGVELGKRGGLVFVISAIEGSPAHKAGIRPMDIVSKINDEDTYNMSLFDAAFKLRGLAESTVEFEIIRVGWYVAKTFSILRSAVKLPDLSYKLLPEKLGFIRIPYFKDSTNTDFRNALEKLREQDAKGYIIDVRSCPGGNILRAIECADMLLEKDALISYTQGQNPTLGEKTEYISKLEQIVNEPVYIMVNFGTSDASEVFAGALSINDRAQIFAERWITEDVRDELITEFNKEKDPKKKGVTFGKAMKQHIIPLKSNEIKDSAINITSAFYYLKGGYRIHGIGLVANKIVWRNALDGWVMNEYDTPSIDAKLNEYIEHNVNADSSKMLELAKFDNRNLKSYPKSGILFEQLKTRAEMEHIRFRLREKLREYLWANEAYMFDKSADLQEDELLHQVIYSIATKLKIKLSESKALARYFK